MNLIRINDPESPELAVYKDLNESQLFHYNEPLPGLFVAESPMVITRALEAGFRPVSFLCEERKARELEALLTDHPGNETVPVFTAGDELMLQITGFHLTRGLLGAFLRREQPDLHELLEGKKRIVLLEDVVNPTNIGAIIRSAAALGMEAAVLNQGCADPFYRRAARVSVGTCFRLPFTVYSGGWPEQAFQVFREKGFKIASLALSDHAVGIGDPRLKQEEKLALVLGNEGWGLPERTLELSDYVVKIPMADGVDSLNVAAASAVAFWEISL